MEAESDVYNSIRCSTNHTTKDKSRIQMTLSNSFRKSILKIIRNFLVNLVNDFPCGKKTYQMIKVFGPFSSRQKSYSLNLSSFWFKYFSFSHYFFIEGILQSMLYVWSQRIFILLFIFSSFDFCQPFWISEKVSSCWTRIQFGWNTELATAYETLYDSETKDMAFLMYSKYST